MEISEICDIMRSNVSEYETSYQAKDSDIASFNLEQFANLYMCIRFGFHIWQIHVCQISWCHIDGLVQGCSISGALALKVRQFLSHRYPMWSCYAFIPSKAKTMYERTRDFHDDVMKWKHFRGTGPLGGEFPLTRASDVEHWGFFFFLSAPEQSLSKQSRRRSFETPSHSLWRHCIVDFCKIQITRITWTFWWNGRHVQRLPTKVHGNHLKYRQTSNMSCLKSQHLNISRLV